MQAEILTPRSAIERVLTAKAQPKKFTFYDTKLQKWLFQLTILLLALGAIAGAVSYFSKNSNLALAGIALILSAEVTFLAYWLAQLVPDLAKMRNPEKDFITPYVQTFNDDIDLISELVSTNDDHHLQYAAQGFSLLAEQLRARIALLVGAIDKVGIIPIGITTYFSAAKLLKEGAMFGGAEWVLLTLVLLYLFAIRMSLVAQWLERTALLFRTAAENRKRSNLHRH